MKRMEVRSDAGAAEKFFNRSGIVFNVVGEEAAHVLDDFWQKLHTLLSERERGEHRCTRSGVGDETGLCEIRPDKRTQLVKRHGTDVGTVHPFQFFVIELGAGFIDFFERKFFDHFGAGGDFLVGGDGPAEQSKEIDKGIRDVAESAVFSDGGGAVTFGELATAGSENDRQMSESGRRPAKGGIQADVLGRAGNPFFATQDVGNLHQVIIHDVGEVISGEAVAFDEDEIILLRIWIGDGAADDINKISGAVEGHFEANDGRRAGGEGAGDFVWRKIAAMAVVAGLRALLCTEGFEALGRAETAVSVTGGEKLVGVVLIEMNALGLKIRGVRAADFRAFVPLEAEPTKRVHDVAHSIGIVACAVSVFDAQDKCAAAVAREEPVKESSAGATDMEQAGGAGSEADADGGAIIHGLNGRNGHSGLN